MVAEAAYGALMKLEHELRTGMVRNIQHIHYVNLDVEATAAFVEVFSHSQENQRYDNFEGDRSFSQHASAVHLDPEMTTSHDVFVDSLSSLSAAGRKRHRRLKLPDALAADCDTAARMDSSKKQKITSDSAAEMQAGAPAEDEDCVICLCPMTRPKKLACGHSFCADCIDESFKKCQPKCPSCGRLFGVMKGNQPPGTMTVQSIPDSLPGYYHCDTLVIMYSIPNGIQNVRLTLKF